MNPKLVIESVVSPSYVKIGVACHHEASSQQPSSMISLTYNRLSFLSSSLAINIKSQSERLQITAAIEGLQHSRCYGKRISASIVSKLYGEYDVASAFCAPGDIHVIAKSHASTEAYLVKAGLKSFDKLEFGAFRVEDFSLHILEPSSYIRDFPLIAEFQIPAMVVSVRLPTGMLMAINTRYNMNEWAKLKVCHTESQN